MNIAQIFEIVGYVASILVAVSLLMRSILRLRVINLIGAITFVIYGLLIKELVKNGAAEKYGIKAGDILIESGGVKIKTTDDLRNILRKTSPKQKVPFILSRNGKLKTIYVVPTHNLNINKDILRESLKDISILVSDEFGLNNKIRINDLN